MERIIIPPDDVMDVAEIQQKIETSVFKILTEDENDPVLRMSALMGASINCMFSQCKNLEELIICRNVFMKILDTSIQGVKIIDKEMSSS